MTLVKVEKFEFGITTLWMVGSVTVAKVEDNYGKNVYLFDQHGENAGFSFNNENAFEIAEKHAEGIIAKF